MGPAIVRVTVSVGPPAANGTTTVMGPVGSQAAAEALAEALADADASGEAAGASDAGAGLVPAELHAAAPRRTAASHDPRTAATRREGRGRNESTRVIVTLR
jgi:hypothetical protein